MVNHSSARLGRLGRLAHPAIFAAAAAAIATLALLAASCSSGGSTTADTSSGFDLSDTTPSAPEPLPFDSDEITPVSVPPGVPLLPEMNFTELYPTDEDALFEALFGFLQSVGYNLKVSCAGLTLGAEPPTLCAREVLLRSGSTTYIVGEPEPGLAWYNILTRELRDENGDSQGWAIVSASEVLR